MNDLNFKNTDELRKALQEWASEQQPTPQDPEVPGLAPGLPKDTREAAAKCYADSILSKPTGTWTEEERSFIAKAIAATLHSMGY